MRIHPSENRRLQLLNATRSGRPWESCAEKRLCVSCERTFRGTAATLRQTPTGAARLVCPGCGSTPDAWVRLGNPLTDEEVWSDWERAIAHSSDKIADDGVVAAR